MQTRLMELLAGAAFMAPLNESANTYKRKGDYTPSTLTKKQRLKRNKRNKMQKESRRINQRN